MEAFEEVGALEMFVMGLREAIVGEGLFDLRFDPGGDVRIRADVVLEPAVGVGDLRAVILVDLFDLLRLWIRQVAGGKRSRHEGEQEHTDEDEIVR